MCNTFVYTYLRTSHLFYYYIVKAMMFEMKNKNIPKMNPPNENYVCTPTVCCA